LISHIKTAVLAENRTAVIELINALILAYLIEAITRFTDAFNPPLEAFLLAK
jgi:hypothetical protein